jgi:hypothetical protein
VRSTQTYGYIVALVLLSLFIGTGPGFAASQFPGDHLVKAPIVDPRSPHNHLKFYAFEGDDSDELSNNEGQGNELLGSEVALTHNWGIYRAGDKGGRWSYQFNCQAGVFSQFQESIDDFELVSSDFYVGIPLELQYDRHHRFRFNLYHLSSHLGDEFQERTGRERISFSQEVLRSTYFYYPNRGTRFYLGGEYAVRMDPDVGEAVFLAGVEHDFWDKWFAGVDLRSLERNDWSVASSARVGRYFGEGNMFVGIEAFDGPLQVGQFFREERTYLGLTITFEE